LTVAIKENADKHTHKHTHTLAVCACVRVLSCLPYGREVIVAKSDNSNLSLVASVFVFQRAHTQDAATPSKCGKLLRAPRYQAQIERCYCVACVNCTGYGKKPWGLDNPQPSPKAWLTHTHTHTVCALLPRHGCSSETRCWWAANGGGIKNLIWHRAEPIRRLLCSAPDDAGLRYSPVPFSKGRGFILGSRHPLRSV
jgi:hypothetical protein